MSYGYGGGRANPYDQRGDAPQGGYGAQPYGNAPPSYGRQQYSNAPAMGRDEYSGNNVELEPLTPNGAQFGGGSQLDSPRAILEECREIDRAIDEIEQSSLPALRTLQMSILNNPDPGASTKHLDTASSDIMNTYRSLVDRVRKLKSKPGTGANPQVGKIDRRLKSAMGDYQRLDVEYTKKLQEQMARQYRIVRPEASEQEVREAVEDTSQQQVFSQALMQSNRRDQAQSALSAVQSRHEEIQKIERQMIELAELFQDMDNLVVQQEAAVTNIEMKGEEVVENMDKGNEQIGVAIKSAKNARKWKWWCLGIVVLIIIIIVIIVLIYKFVIQQPAKTTTKRFVLPAEKRRVVSTYSTPTEERSVVPGLKWTRDNNLAVVPGAEWVPPSEKPVVPGAEWAPPSKKERRFQA